MSARLPRLLLSLTAISLAPVSVHAAPEGAVRKRLGEALMADKLDSLRVVWTSGVPGAGPFRRLRVDGDRAVLERCEAAESCRAVGAGLTLSGGERQQLLSRLRAAELGSLRDGESDGAPDRQLEVEVAGSEPAAWRLGRAEWPTPPDGYGVADFLDDLGRRIEQRSQARAPLAVPGSVAELDGVRLKLHVQPRTRPGGLLVVEGGRLSVTPEEGSLPRAPRPRPFERSLTADEKDRLVRELQAARLDDLDGLVPKRQAPAIGDDDGRLLTLHLLPSEAAIAKAPGPGVGQPRGYERYVADLARSPAAGLVQDLLGLLVTESAQRTAAPSPPPSARGASRRR